MTKRKVGILISGRGSNMSALIEAAKQPDYPAEIALVLSNRPEAAGLRHATDAGIATGVISHRDFADKRSFEEAMDERLREAGIDLICLAGFMRLLSPWFVDAWRDRTLNIHPSLLPSFKGLDTHARALAAGVRVHGCTVHIVRAEMDDGPIVAQAAVPVSSQDTAESLAARVLGAEHRLYPHALALIASGRAIVEGERVRVDAEAVLPQMIIV
ncbi:phosphoribosylglycinamide formyltransferase [Agaricicola taiwanensis]|uniref:Phosphoribosylglycinamide formyltransferase n=1 Tax=Agaricicola taiwanensis TaxID=591372 RepID=A0A8J2YHI5_9RHOB|nr:phosphoribosylglycinamide formyltransferase [Agaricicola taiwanensis]GGE43155.1 phosphoribosylglycinamide formyltransferase [Agaricicola taiwanensis]